MLVVMPEAEGPTADTSASQLIFHYSTPTNLTQALFDGGARIGRH
jgi:hypothetical protein